METKTLTYEQAKQLVKEHGKNWINHMKDNKPKTGDLFYTSTKKYAIKPLSAFDVTTGPFDTFQQAKDYLLRNSNREHIKRHFKSTEHWINFMVYEIN